MENNHKAVVVSVAVGDVTSFKADVLVLKYAQAHYGIDGIVSQRVTRRGVDENQFAPRPGVSSYFSSCRGICPANILVVGVKGLYDFSYKDIRIFARTALEALADIEKDTSMEHVCFTLHGAEYGLDEVEAFESEIAGLIDGITSGRIPKTIQQISIVEIDDRRAGRLKEVLRELIPLGYVEQNRNDYLQASEESVYERVRSVGYSSADKPHVFVAMPFREEMEDVYEYGIRNAVRKAGFLCERADLSAFTGDVMDWVRMRIRSASLVIADLTSTNPNVYLEVGYAWGVGVKTVLLARDTEQLKFDVRSQRCIVYSRIKDLEKKLYKELVALSEDIFS